jgi:hypothetical protein
MKVIVIGLVLVALFVYGCETPSGPGNCPNEVSIRVQIEENPIFFWDPPCEVDMLTVYHHVISVTGIPTLDPVWTLQAGSLPIATPITYGIKPEGATETSAKPLIEGDEYRVRIDRYITEMPGFDKIGEVDFVYTQ